MSDADLERRITDALLICRDIDDKEAITVIVGARYDALNDMCCDLHRYQMLLDMGRQAADEMMSRYQKARKNARH